MPDATENAKNFRCHDSVSQNRILQRKERQVRGLLLVHRVSDAKVGANVSTSSDVNSLNNWSRLGSVAQKAQEAKLQSMTQKMVSTVKLG